MSLKKFENQFEMSSTSYIPIFIVTSIVAVRVLDIVGHSLSCCLRDLFQVLNDNSSG